MCKTPNIKYIYLFIIITNLTLGSFIFLDNLLV